MISVMQVLYVRMGNVFVMKNTLDNIVKLVSIYTMGEQLKLEISFNTGVLCVQIIFILNETNYLLNKSSFYLKILLQ